MNTITVAGRAKALPITLAVTATKGPKIKLRRRCAPMSPARKNVPIANQVVHADIGPYPLGSGGAKVSNNMRPVMPTPNRAAHGDARRRA
jgi:hypothetical protein